MNEFPAEYVRLLHQYIVDRTGGSDELRDFNLLDSALSAAYATFDGVELMPSKEEKAAKLGFSLISNHAFVDGNKRIGMYIMMMFLKSNGVDMDCSNEDIIQAGMSVADGSMGYEGLLEWIRSHRAN